MKTDTQISNEMASAVEIPLSHESLKAQRDSLAEAIAFLAVKAGIVAPAQPLNGPQIMMLASDLRDAANGLSKVTDLVAENARLLPKAARELSNAWVLQKYWVGINAALMHIWAGRQADAVAWLENTVFCADAEVPQLTDSAEIEAWASGMQKDSISHAKALEILKKEAPVTVSVLASAESRGVDKFAEFLDEPIDGKKCFEHAAGLARHFASTLRKGRV